MPRFLIFWWPRDCSSSTQMFHCIEGSIHLKNELVAPARSGFGEALGQDAQGDTQDACSTQSLPAPL
jgi:hypothetical protein